jgi:hypothetical protein
MLTPEIRFNRSRPLYMPGETVEGEIVLSRPIISSQKDDDGDNDETPTSGHDIVCHAVVVTLMGVAQCGFWKRTSDKASSPSGKLLQTGKQPFLYQPYTLLGDLYETGPLPIYPGYQRVSYYVEEDSREALVSFQDAHCQGLGDIGLRASRGNEALPTTWLVRVCFEPLQRAEERPLLTQGRSVGETLLDLHAYSGGGLVRLPLSPPTRESRDAGGKFQDNPVQASSFTFSLLPNTDEYGERSHRGSSDLLLTLRVHSVDFAEPVHESGQVYVQAFPAEVNSTNYGIPAVVIQAATLPRRIRFSLQLPNHVPASVKWSQGKRYNGSIRYWLGASLTSPNMASAAIQESLWLLPAARIEAPIQITVYAQANKQALTYTSWNYLTTETKHVDLKLCLPRNVLIPGQGVSMDGTTVTNHTSKTVEIQIRLNQHVELTALDGDVVMKHGWNAKYAFVTTARHGPKFQASCGPGETWTMPPGTPLVVPSVPSTFTDTRLFDWPIQWKYSCQLCVSIPDSEALATTETPVLLGAYLVRSPERKDTTDPGESFSGALTIRDDSPTNNPDEWDVTVDSIPYKFWPTQGILAYDRRAVDG